MSGGNIMAKTGGKTGWSASTFEVQTARGSRWLIDMTAQKRSDALERAEALVALGSAEGVRVTELRDGWPKEKVIFERSPDGREKALAINPVPDLEMCKRLADYYALPSRLTIGRVMRAYLDKHGLTALELMFNAGHLRMLDRMDNFFPSALQHIAQLQAKKTEQTKMQRMDKLCTVFDKVLKRAKTSGDDYEAFAANLAKRGPDSAIAKVRAANPKAPDIAVYGMLAAHIEGATWSDKLGLAIDMADKAAESGTVVLADEIIAEILDGMESINELFRGFSNGLDAWKTYVKIIGGRMDNPPKYMSPQIARLNALFMRYDMAATRDVLLKRIARGLGGTQSLSKDGREADRASFVTLVRELIEPCGLHGGPHMVEAMVLRAKTLLGEDGADLSIDTALRQALYLMPSQAVRLGVLLDLSQTGLGRKHEGLVRQQLLLLLEQLRNIFDLFPAEMHDDERVHSIDRLRERLGMSLLTGDLKSTLDASLIKLARGEVVEGAEPAPKAKAKPGEVTLKKGEVLFREGEQGEEAYLVVGGELEVFRSHGGKTQHLAVLGQGELIGEMSLIDNQPRMASVRATKHAQLACISKENFQKRLDGLAKSDMVLHLLVKTLGRRLRGVARLIE